VKDTIHQLSQNYIPIPILEIERLTLREYGHGSFGRVLKGFVIYKMIDD